MNKIILFIMLFLMPTITNAQEVIAEMDKAGLSTLNEELRQSSSSLRNTKSLVTTLQEDVNTLKTINDEWIDYSSSSTVVGWSSFTTKEIFYKVVGKTVFVRYLISGTSDSVLATFTLPYNMKRSIYSFGHTDDASPNSIGSIIPLYSGSDMIGVNLRRNTTELDWTASGDKTASGQFFYEMI